MRILAGDLMNFQALARNNPHEALDGLVLFHCIRCVGTIWADVPYDLTVNPDERPLPASFVGRELLIFESLFAQVMIPIEGQSTRDSV